LPSGSQADHLRRREEIWSVTCGGHYLRVATDTRGHLIYLHVADRLLDDLSGADLFNGLLETLELGTDRLRTPAGRLR
jgi:hypothetical protein